MNSIRTDLSDDERKWLELKAEQQGVTLAAIVRRAIRLFKMDEIRRNKLTYVEILKLSKGTWSGGDAGTWVRDLRTSGWR